MLSTLFSPLQRLKTGKASGLALGLVAGLGLVAVPETFALGQTHPAYTIRHILPTEMAAVPGVSGIDFLPNGDGVISVWGGNMQSKGEVWIVKNLASGTPGAATQIATGLREALGVKVIGNDFYVMEKPRIIKFVGSGTTFTKSTFFTLPTAWYNDQQWHHFSFGLTLRDSAFWFSTGTAYDYTPSDPIQRGALIRVPLSGSGFTQHARGLRNPPGVALGPENEFFVTENEGHWKPVDGLYHLRTQNVPANGRFYGFRTTGNNACGTTPPNVAGDNCPNDPEYPPAVWIPHAQDFTTSSFAQSPTEPILLKHGPYAGQMLGGDIHLGGLLRYYLEKVGDDYQGAVFKFITSGSQGINYGVFKLNHLSDGALITSGLGGGSSLAGCVLDSRSSGNWNTNGACRGMSVLTPTAAVPFEMLAIRSTPDGFEIEFTKPAGAAASNAASYSVRSSVHTPVQAYGADASNTDNNVTVAVTSATLSPDGKRVSLKLASLLTKRMYGFTLNGITSATGEALYTNQAFYTLNKVNTATGVTDSREKFAKAKVLGLGRNLFRFDSDEAYELTLARPDGKVMRRLAGKAGQSFSANGLEAGLYLISGQVGGKEFRQTLVLR